MSLVHSSHDILLTHSAARCLGSVQLKQRFFSAKIFFLPSTVDTRGQLALLWDVSLQYTQAQDLAPCCRVLNARRDWRLDSTILRCVHDFKVAHNCRKSQFPQTSLLRTTEVSSDFRQFISGEGYISVQFNQLPQCFERLDVVQQPFVKLMYFLGLVSTNLLQF